MSEFKLANPWWLAALAILPVSAGGLALNITEQRRANRRIRQLADQRPRPNIIAGLAAAQKHPDRPPRRVGDSVELRVEATLRAPDQAPRPPFLSPKLEAVRWVLRWVASIISVSVPPPWSASSSRIRAKTPLSLQRFQRL